MAPSNIIKPKVTLVGVDGNAFAVMGFVANALKRAGNPPEVIAQYRAEATSGDYQHLLAVSMDYIDMEGAAEDAEEDEEGDEGDALLLDDEEEDDSDDYDLEEGAAEEMGSVAADRAWEREQQDAGATAAPPAFDPNVTDRERVRRAFAALRKQGFVAHMNFLCCMGCASAEIADRLEKKGVKYEDIPGHVFYTRQDEDAFKRLVWRGNSRYETTDWLQRPLYIAWGGDANTILAALHAEGLETEWDGNPMHRIQVLSSDPARRATMQPQAA